MRTTLLIAVSLPLLATCAGCSPNPEGDLEKEAGIVARNLSEIAPEIHWSVRHVFSKSNTIFAGHCGQIRVRGDGPSLRCNVRLMYYHVHNSNLWEYGLAKGDCDGVDIETVVRW